MRRRDTCTRYSGETPTRWWSEARWWIAQRLSPFRDHGLAARIQVPHDVRRVEEPELLEAADRAPLAVRRDHHRTEAPLVHAGDGLADRVAARERVVEEQRCRVGQRRVPDADARADWHAPLRGTVLGHVVRVVRLVPARPGGEEVRDRHLELVGEPERPIVGLGVRPRAVGVEEALVGNLVAVGLPVGGDHGERCGPPLGGRAVDALHVAEEGNPNAARGEAAIEGFGVRELLAELDAQSVEGEETRCTEVLVPLHGGGF